MKAELLVHECMARKECNVNGEFCLYTRECELFKDLYGCPPYQIKDLTEAEERVVSAHVRRRFNQLLSGTK